MVPVPGLSFHEGTYNPNEVGVALPGTRVMVEVVVVGFVPSEVRWI